MNRGCRRMFRRARRALWATAFMICGPPLLLTDAFQILFPLLPYFGRFSTPIRCLICGCGCWLAMVAIFCPEVIVAWWTLWDFNPIPHVSLVKFEIALSFGWWSLTTSLLSAITATFSVIVLLILKVAVVMACTFLAKPFVVTIWVIIWSTMYLAWTGVDSHQRPNPPQQQAAVH